MTEYCALELCKFGAEMNMKYKKILVFVLFDDRPLQTTLGDYRHAFLIIYLYFVD